MEYAKKFQNAFCLSAGLYDVTEQMPNGQRVNLSTSSCSLVGSVLVDKYIRSEVKSQARHF